MAVSCEKSRRPLRWIIEVEVLKVVDLNAKIVARLGEWGQVYHVVLFVVSVVDDILFDMIDEVDLTCAGY